MPPAELLVVQRVLPPYRLPFFQRLAASDNVRLTVAYGREAPHSGLESILAPAGVNARHVRNFYLAGKDMLVYQRGVPDLLRRGSCDVVVAEFNPRILSNLVALFRARRLGIPFLWWGQGLSPRPGGVAPRLRARLAGRAQAVILYDKERADRLAALGVPREKLFVAWNTIDTEEIERLRAPYDPAARNRVLFVGRLAPEKKVPLLLRAFAEARPSLPAGTRLAIVGDGPDSARIREMVDALGLGGTVELPGALYGQESLAPWFNSAWLSVSPGAIGLAAIHSLAYGVPLLVADGEAHGPEVTALEEETNALFFPSGDLHALADALVRLGHEPARLAGMSQAGLATVAGCYSLSAMVGVFEQAIEHALGQRVR